jgi:hypothetical protein
MKEGKPRGRPVTEKFPRVQVSVRKDAGYDSMMEVAKSKRWTYTDTVKHMLEFIATMDGKAAFLAWVDDPKPKAGT